MGGIENVSKLMLEYLKKKNILSFFLKKKYKSQY